MFFPWAALMLARHRIFLHLPGGLYTLLTIMAAGILLTGAAAFLHSRWWLLATTGAVASFAIVFVAEMS